MKPKVDPSHPRARARIVKEGLQTCIEGHSPTVALSINIYRHKQETPNPGYYIYIPRRFGLAWYPLPGNQFVGMHKCLCLTIQHPKRTTDLIKISKALPTMEPFGPTVWLARVKAYLKTHQEMRAYIPENIWPEAARVPVDNNLRSTAICQSLIGTDGNDYTVLHIAAVTADGLLRPLLKE